MAGRQSPLQETRRHLSRPPVAATGELLLMNTVLLTEPINSRMVANTEVTFRDAPFISHQVDIVRVRRYSGTNRILIG